MDCKGQDQYFTEDVVLHISSVDFKRNRVLQINSIYPILTCWLFLLNQRVVRLISVLNCSKFDYDLEGFNFLSNSYCEVMKKCKLVCWRQVQRTHLFACRSKRIIKITCISSKIIGETDFTAKSCVLRYLITLDNQF